MKLKDFLTEAYGDNDVRKTESAIRYALNYLSYIDKGNELLKTEDILHYGEERENTLTGKENIEKGVYLLWSIAHDGAEWLMRFETKEEAEKEQEEINQIKFSNADACFLKVVE